MGNFCYENRNIDEGNFGSEKPKTNTGLKNQEKNDINDNNKIYLFGISVFNFYRSKTLF